MQTTIRFPRESFATNTAPPVVITGTEGMSVQLSACCRPIPGDDIMGYIGIGLGMAIHTTDCRVAQRIHRRDPGRWIDVAWAPQPGRLFDVAVKVLVKNAKGVFARVAADITSADANIVHIAMDEDVSQEATFLRFVIQVSDRVHLANVMRRVRTNPDVMRIARERPSEEAASSPRRRHARSIASAPITDHRVPLFLARRRWDVTCVPVPIERTRGTTMQTSDLEGPALDYWVARSLHDFIREIHFTDSGETLSIRGNDRGNRGMARFLPSTSWEAASVVLERACRLEMSDHGRGGWHIASRYSARRA